MSPSKDPDGESCLSNGNVRVRCALFSSSLFIVNNSGAMCEKANRNA